MTGTISGLVTDPNSAFVPGAKVTAKNMATNATTQTQTDQNGYYRFPNLSPGNYAINVDVKGFRKAELAARELTVSGTLREDVALQIGEISETVTVEAGGATVNTEDSQLGHGAYRNSRAAQYLGSGRSKRAQSGRASARRRSGARFRWQCQRRGGRTQSNNYLLDGTDSNDLAINVPDALGQISPDAVQEFRVVTGAMKAEDGRSGGVVVEAVTKSGTNVLHGGGTNARVVLQHLEADGIDPAEEFLLGLDAHVQVVIEKIVVGSVAAVFAAKQVGSLGLGGKNGDREQQEGTHAVRIPG